MPEAANGASRKVFAAEGRSVCGHGARIPRRLPPQARLLFNAPRACSILWRHGDISLLISNQIRLMAELHEVHQRLEAALGRLDSAVRSRMGTAESRAQIDALSKELERANADHAQLQDTSSAIARGLDTTIERLRRILGE
jgi:hypothetical protein